MNDADRATRAPDGLAARASDPPQADVAARAAAALLDVALALGAGLAGSVALARTGLLAPRIIDAESATPPIVRAALGVAVLLFLLRDLAPGGSLGKRFVGLRVVDAAGLPLPAARRVLPRLGGGGVSPSTRTARHAVYAPISRRGLAIRAALALFAAVWSIRWAADVLRPSLPAAEAERLVRATLLSDAALRARLGEPVAFEVVRILPRGRVERRGVEGAFDLHVWGPLGRQEMRVRACKVDGEWHVEELSDVHLTDSTAAPPDTFAAR